MVKIYDSLYAPPKRRSALNFIVNLVLALVVLALGFEIVLGMFYKPFYIVNISMTPTLTGAKDEKTAGGDYVYIDPNATPDYGKIIVMFDGNQNIIKRVIAFEGDTVRMDRGQLYIRYAGETQFEPIDEYYIAEGYCSPYEPVNTFSEHTVMEGGVFLMGDNRNHSTDSRANGDYLLSNVVGVVTDWSLRYKAQITAFQTFFRFTLPQAFGL